MKLNKSAWIVCLVVYLLSFSRSEAQDISFTQYLAIPYQTNPSLTGATESSYRLGMIYRSQWHRALESDYTTFALGGEVQFDTPGATRKKGDRFALGLYFFNDQVQLYALNHTQIAISSAYHKVLNEDRNTTFGAGVQLSVNQRNINYDKLTFGDQFDETSGFNLATAEQLPPNNFGFGDLSLGLNYSSEATETLRFALGAAYHHLLGPNLSFYDAEQNLDPSIDPNADINKRLAVHLNLGIKLDNFIELQPRILYQQQGPNTLINFGANYRYEFKGVPRALNFGFYIDAVEDVDQFSMRTISPLFGIELNGLLLGFSYDFQLAPTSAFIRNFNSFELSIRYDGEYENEDQFCPKF